MFSRALGTPTTGFEGQFRFLADVQGLGTAAGRHPSADLLPVFNASYRQLREYVTAKRYTQYVTRGTTTALPTTPVEAGEQYAVIALGTTGVPGTAPAAHQIKMIDVKVGAGDWYPLPELTLLQLRELRPSRNGGDTCPRGWCLLNMGATSGANFSVAGQIAIAPVPTSGSYALWTMNETPDLVATTDVYYYHNESWAQWHMYHAMQQIVGVRDKDTARKLEAIRWHLNEDNPGSPAWHIAHHAPTASGPRTWVRGADYRGPGAWR